MRWKEYNENFSNLGLKQKWWLRKQILMSHLIDISKGIFLDILNYQPVLVFFDIIKSNGMDGVVENPDYYSNQFQNVDDILKMAVLPKVETFEDFINTHIK
jgi:hypothetical protein